MVQRTEGRGHIYCDLGSIDSGSRDLLQVDERGGEKKMTDLSILVCGIAVFGLMLIGVVLTVLEFRQLSETDAAESDSELPGSKSRHV